MSPHPQSVLIRKSVTVALAVLGIHLMAGRAAAIGVTYEMTVTASGTLGAVPFTDALVTMRLVSDTSNVTFDGATNPAFPLWLNTGVTTIDIAGLGSATFTGHVFGVFHEDLELASPGADAIGFADLTLYNFITAMLIPDSAYDLTTATTLSFATAFADNDPQHFYTTDQGDLVFSGAGESGLFVTTVPEPGVCGAVAGLALAGWMVLKRRGTTVA